MTKMEFLALLIVFWSSLVFAGPSCKQLFSNLPAIISFENQESLSNYSMVLEKGPEVILEYQKVKDREGDEITILGRRDSTRSRWLGRHNTVRLWSRLLERYYLSFTIRNNLLSNQGRSKMSYGQESLDRLLSVQNVNNPRFPKLRPAVVKHEDYHLGRLEYDSFNRWEAAYETGNRQQDLPDLEVTSGISYKFSSHGDSHKNGISYLGQRFELRIPYQTKVPDALVYQKARFNDKGVVIARTLVIKTPKGTSRVRLAVGMTQNIVSMISEILSRDHQMKIDSIKPGQAVMTLGDVSFLVENREPLS